MKELNRLLIEPTNKTPQIDFDQMTGDLIIHGKSIPENAARIYEPLLKWVSEYIHNPRQTTNLRLNLEYFNTATSIWIAKIVKTICKMKDADNVFLVHLYFPIEEFDEMQVEDIKDELNPVFDLLQSDTISIGVKIYGTDDRGMILKESMVLI